MSSLVWADDPTKSGETKEGNHAHLDRASEGADPSYATALGAGHVLHLGSAPQYLLPASDADFGDPFAAGQQSHHIPTTYAHTGGVSGGAVGAIDVRAPDAYSFHTHHAQHHHHHHQTEAHNPSFRDSNHLSDSSSVSIANSPSPGGSNILYDQFTSYQGSVPLAQPFVSPALTHHPPSAYVGTRVPPIADGTRVHMPPPNLPPRGSSTVFTALTDRDSYNTLQGSPYLSSYRPLPPPVSHTHLHNSSIPTLHPQFVSSPHRPLFGSPFVYQPAVASIRPAGPMASPSPISALHSTNNATSGNHQSQSDSRNFPFSNLEITAEIVDSNNVAVTLDIHVKVERGFFLSTTDNRWTCYRRNYFIVASSFELHPPTPNVRLFLKRNGGTEQIQAFGMRLAANVDGVGGRPIELVQHTPKRDNGPKTKIEIVKVPPAQPHSRTEAASGLYAYPQGPFVSASATPGPILPLQHEPVASASSSSSSSSSGPSHSQSSNFNYGVASGHLHAPPSSINGSHTFERVQFKQATANNGKRRSSQQYFTLALEIYADVRNVPKDKDPAWVKVAHRTSDKIVVRGRSPSHYQNETQHGHGGRSGGGGSSGGGGGGSGGGGSGGYGSVHYPSTHPGSAYSSFGHSDSLRSGTGILPHIGYGAHLGPAPDRGYHHHHYCQQPQYACYSTSEESGTSSPGNGGSSPEHVIATDSRRYLPPPLPPTGPADDSQEPVRSVIPHHHHYRYYPIGVYSLPPQQLPLPPLDGMGAWRAMSSDPRAYSVKTEYVSPDESSGSGEDGRRTWSPPNDSYVSGGVRFQHIDSSRGCFPEVGPFGIP